MVVGPAATTPASATTATFTGGSLATTPRRRKHGELLGQLGRAAMGTLRSFPIARANQNLAVLLAGRAMKLVYWHGSILAGSRWGLKCGRAAVLPLKIKS